MLDNIVKIITTEAISVDFFKGERKIALFTDGNYKELKFISGEYGVKKYSLNDDVTRTNASLIVGFGGSEILRKAKDVSIKEGGNLILIPTTPVVYDFLPYSILKNLHTENEFDGHTVLLVKDILNNQPKEKSALTLGSIAAVLVSLLDSAFNCFVNDEDVVAIKLLDSVKNTLSKCSEYVCSTPTLGFELANLLGSLCNNLSFDQPCLPLIASYIFSLYKKEKMQYNEYMFGIAFAIFAIIDSYKVQAELLLPPKRREIRAELKNIVPEFNEYVSIEPKEFILRNFILNDRLFDIKTSIDKFNVLAKNYLRLNGNSGFALRNRYTADELLKILPLACEAINGNSILKHIYSSGIMT